MEKLDIYRCNICGNIVEVLVSGTGELVCCGEPMQKLEARKTEEAMYEKHIPVFNKNEDGKLEIRVGEVLHPMLEEHHIMFIQAISEDKNSSQLKFLHPNEEPKMLSDELSPNMIAREYCNIHGLWEATND